MKVVLTSQEVAKIVSDHLARQKGKSQGYSIRLDFTYDESSGWRVKNDWELHCTEIEMKKGDD